MLVDAKAVCSVEVDAEAVCSVLVDAEAVCSVLAGAEASKLCTVCVLFVEASTRTKQEM